MIGIAIAVILVILAVGIVLKLLKLAIIVALVVGGLMLAQNYFGPKRLK